MELKHFYTVKNGKPVYEDEKLYNIVMRQNEGKRCYNVIRPVTKEISPGTYNYYFGYIIAECKNIFIFAGWSYSDIHNHLWKELRPGLSFASAKAKDLLGYIEELIPYLFEKYKLVIQPDTKFSKIIS